MMAELYPENSHRMPSPLRGRPNVLRATHSRNDRTGQKKGSRAPSARGKRAPQGDKAWGLPGPPPLSLQHLQMWHSRCTEGPLGPDGVAALGPRWLLDPEATSQPQGKAASDWRKSDTGPEPTKGQTSLKAATLVREVWKGLVWDLGMYTVSPGGPRQPALAPQPLGCSCSDDPREPAELGAEVAPPPQLLVV